MSLWGVQWNLSNADTFRTKLAVLISEVSLFQEENNSVLINKVSLFQRCPLREVSLQMNQLDMV